MIGLPLHITDLHKTYAGNARLAAALNTPIQIGENFSQPHAMHEALRQKACDYVMPDLERIGGVSGWREAAALAAMARRNSAPSCAI
mgnify:CR=1 FL=1